MNVLNLLELNGFTVKLLAVSVIVATAELLLKKFGEILPAFIVKYLPLILAEESMPDSMKVEKLK